MTKLFIEFFWMGPFINAILRISDYLFTISCAKLYKAQNVIEYEGSFELTPQFQADVDALRLISPRFIGVLIMSSILIFVLWLLCSFTANWGLYLFGLGAMIIPVLIIHIRHFYNWFTFRYGVSTGGIEGHVKYHREYMLRSSAFDILLFAGLFLIISAISFDWFFLGGGIAGFSGAFQHYRLALKHRDAKTKSS